VAVFVSSQAVDRDPARQLIGRLQSVGVRVEHSPSNPLDREDARWPDWYQEGLRAALGRCRLFVIVVDAGWDSSTWMAQEAHAALESDRMIRHLEGFFWNPTGAVVRAAGMVRYLKVELPVEIEDAVGILKTQVGRMPTRSS
jgi:TIR domain